MKPKSLKNFLQYKSFILLAMLIFLASLLDKTFTTSANITNILQQIASNGIVSVGMTLVILTGGFDMSVGSTMALTGIVIMLMLKAGSNLFLAILCGVFVGVLTGLANGLLISKVKLSPFIATLATSTLSRGISFGVTNHRPVSVWNETFYQLATGSIGLIPISFLLFIVLAILTQIFISRTKLGHNIYIYGSNKEVGYAAGLNMDRTLILTYTISGFLASIGGLFLSSKLGTGSPVMAEDVALVCTTAVIIGGNRFHGNISSVKSMLRTVIGIFILGVLNNMLNLLGTMSYIQIIIRGLLVIIVIAVDSGVKEIRSTLVERIKLFFRRKDFE